MVLYELVLGQSCLLRHTTSASQVSLVCYAILPVHLRLVLFGMLYYDTTGTSQVSRVCNAILGVHLR